MERSYWAIILITISLFGCRKADIGDINNLNGGRILILGHAGLGFSEYSNPYPDNSATSIERAIDGFTADGVEVDIQLSADSCIFLYHNDLLESATNCNGCIQDHSSDVIQNCSYKENFSSNLIDSEPIYSLEALFATYSKYKDLYFLLDVKHYPHCIQAFKEANYSEALLKQVLSLARKYRLTERLFIEVVSEAEVKFVKDRESGIKVFTGIKDPSEDLSGAASSGADGIMVRNENITKEEVKKAHDLGLMVALFGVETRMENIESVEKYPDIILSDNIRLTQEVMLQK